jgi:hypothetical protein
MEVYLFRLTLEMRDPKTMTTENQKSGNAEGSLHRIVRRPKVVCLCGSSRFFTEYQIAEYEETMAGKIYLSIGFCPHGEMHGEGVGHSSSEKIALDELHKRKIDMCDEVYVLNVGGYIGDSTKSEVSYAMENGKPIRWLEPERAWHPSPSNGLN